MVGEEDLPEDFLDAEGHPGPGWEGHKDPSGAFQQSTEWHGSRGVTRQPNRVTRVTIIMVPERAVPQASQNMRCALISLSNC